MNTAATPTETNTREWLQPYLLAVPFTAIITGWFSLAEWLPVALALVIGATWGILLGLIASWLRRKSTMSAWIEDTLVVLGATALAFSAAGGVMGLLILKAALNSPSLTGETLVQMFLPMIPYYIIANGSMELLIIPSLLYLSWRAGKRRILIVVAAALFFAFRVWSYLAFVPNRLAFAELEGKGTPFTAVEREQASIDLQVDDPRWVLGLTIFAIFMLAVHIPRVRELSH